MKTCFKRTMYSLLAFHFYAQAAVAEDWVKKANDNLIKLYAEDTLSALRREDLYVDGLDEKDYEPLAEITAVMLSQCTIDFIKSFPEEEREFLLTRAAWDGNLKGFQTSVDTLMGGYYEGEGGQAAETLISSLKMMVQCVDASFNSTGIRSSGIRSSESSQCENNIDE